MEKYDVVIAGGGVSGLSCALTLASAKKSQDWAKEKKILLIDDDGSDLKKAHLFNAPNIAGGTAGKEALAQLKKQVEDFKSIDFAQDTVTDVKGEKDNFNITLQNGKDISTTLVVVATGFHEMKIQSLSSQVIANANAPRPGKIQFKVNEESQIKPGLFAAGLVSGLSSMFAVAAGSGVQVACNIFKIWKGSPTIVHDVWKQ